MEEYLPLIVQLVSGAVGGNVVAKIFKNLSLGKIGNSIAGILGGGLGGYLLSAIGMDAGGAEMEISSILGNVAGGGVGGGVLMVIIGIIKGALKK